MYCKYCGTQIAEDSNFCPNCGSNLQAEVSLPSTAVVAQPTKSKSNFGLGIKSMVFGAIGMDLAMVAGIFLLYFFMVFATLVPAEEYGPCFAVAVMLMAFPVIGLSFSRGASNCASEFKDLEGKLNPFAQVGRILSIPGKIINIICLVIYAFCAFGCLVNAGA